MTNFTLYNAPSAKQTAYNNGKIVINEINKTGLLNITGVYRWAWAQVNGDTSNLSDEKIEELLNANYSYKTILKNTGGMTSIRSDDVGLRLKKADDSSGKLYNMWDTCQATQVAPIAYSQNWLQLTAPVGIKGGVPTSVFYFVSKGDQVQLYAKYDSTEWGYIYTGVNATLSGNYVALGARFDKAVVY